MEDGTIEVDTRPKEAAMKKGVSFSDSQQTHALGTTGNVHRLNI